LTFLVWNSKVCIINIVGVRFKMPLRIKYLKLHNYTCISYSFKLYS